MLASVALGFVGVLLNYLWAEAVLGILLNIVGSTLIVTWVATIVSHLILRRRAERDGTPMPVQGRGFPYVNYLALAIIAAIIVLGMGVPDVRFQLLATGALVVVLWVIGAALARRRPELATADRV